MLDAHWIYGGDPLLLGIQVATPDEAPELFTELIAEPEVEEAAVQPLSPYPFVQLGHADDIYCSGFIGDLEETFPFRVSGSEYEILGPTFNLATRGTLRAEFGVVDTIKYGLSMGDIVYLEGGRAVGMQPGDMFTSVAPAAVVRHPATGDRLGRFYSYLGQVRLLSVQAESAIGEIVQSCSFIRVGSMLKPFEPEPVPSKRKKPSRPPSHPASRDALSAAASIIYAKDGLVVLGRDHVVFIDQGEDHGLSPGDIMTVYRVPAQGAPPLLLGELALLSVRQTTSAAKLVESRHPIYVGDIAHLN